MNGRRDIKIHLAIHEILVMYVSGGDYQPTDVYNCVLAEQDARPIGDHHRTIGGKASQDGGNITPYHPIEGDRTTRWLLEIGLLICANVEGFPVNDRIGGILDDIEPLRGNCLYGGRTSNDASPRGIC